MPNSIRPGDVLAGRYLLEDLLSESGNGRFWRAHDRTLDRHVSVHVIGADDDRAEGMMAAARRSATVLDRRILRVLDVDEQGDVCYVVNEWGSGTSLDILVANEGPVGARRAAWIVSEVAGAIAVAHDAGVAHGRLVPENVLIDLSGSVRVIGFSVDAALMGLPPGRLSSDVTDLAGLLYFLLTGRWPGVSRSAVPPAPLEGGRVLRPRQVRAGVPRPLDALCDQVINFHTAAGDAEGLDTAHGICELLREFVGDASGMAAAEAAAGRRNGAPGAETRLLPLVSPVPTPPPEAHLDTEAQPATEQAATEPAPPNPAVPVEQPTEAGLPIFDDDSDEVAWYSARAATPPPPPPFEEPPERPLFAPDPVDGRPARQSRPGAAQPGGQDFWPWDASTGTGSRVTTGSGVIPLPEDEEEEDDGVPGRSWLRLAGVVGACTLLLLAIIVAFNLGRGRSPLGSLPESEQSPSTPSGTTTAEAAAPLTGLTATDLDPQGDPPEENPDLAPLVVDGDPETAWRTETYLQNFGPSGLKTGAGLTLDLGGEQQVSAVDLTMIGAPTGVSLFVTDKSPTDVGGLKPVATETLDGPRARITLDQPATGRFLVVWLTSIPAVEGGFRGQVAEVVVRG
ncbi:MAG: protein kinase family protein [Nocardioides sp.]